MHPAAMAGGYASNSSIWLWGERVELAEFQVLTECDAIPIYDP